MQRFSPYAPLLTTESSILVEAKFQSLRTMFFHCSYLDHQVDLLVSLVSAIAVQSVPCLAQRSIHMIEVK